MSSVLPGQPASNPSVNTFVSGIDEDQKNFN